MLEELLTEPEELPCILEDVAEFPAEDSAPEEIKSAKNRLRSL